VTGSRSWWGLAALVAGALALRLAGLQFGLPAVYNPDEVAIMSRALAFATGTLNPHNFLYPTFFFYVLFAWVGAWLAILLATGQVASLQALRELIFTAPTTIYTAGRALGAVAGTASVLALYRLGTAIADRPTAAAAAVFLAVAPLHVRDSHYVKHDVPATLAVIVAYVAIVRIWRKADAVASGGATPRRDLLIAGAACGVAFSIHYYCVFLALPLAWAILVRDWRSGVGIAGRQLAWAAAAAAVVFFVLSPFILVEPLTAWRDITANRAIVVDRAVEAGAFAPALRYARMLWQDAAGIPVTALAAVGIVRMLLAAPARAALLLAFPIPFLVFIANTAPASRYLNPVLPFVALFAAWTLADLAGRLRLRPPVFAALVALVAAPALVASVRADRFLRQDDTRTLALRWIEANVPAESTLLVQPYSVPLTMSRPALVEALRAHLGSEDRASTKFRLQLGLDPYPAPAYRLLYLGDGGLDVDRLYLSYADVSGADAIAVLKRHGVAFVVLKRYNRPDPAVVPLLAALAREGRRIAAFSPYRPDVAEAVQARVDPFLHNTDTRIDDALARPGPPLEIWQLDGAE
jgi:Dolichyl-phosphate-mannose-protein mannosyltransferase